MTVLANSTAGTLPLAAGLVGALALCGAVIDSEPAHDVTVSNSAYVSNLIDRYCGAVRHPLSDPLRTALHRGFRGHHVSGRAAP